MPPFEAKLPVTVSVPIELPGDRIPPLEKKPPIEPVPRRKLAASIVTTLARAPLAYSVLPVTVVGPV